jgi:hypothetical protein
VVEVLEVAALELAEAGAWYENRVAGLGERFLLEVQGVFEFIEGNPGLGSPWLLKGIPPGVLHVPLRTFPYSVVFVLEPRMVVIAVAHGSKEPTYWVERLGDVSRGG